MADSGFSDGEVSNDSVVSCGGKATSSLVYLGLHDQSWTDTESDREVNDFTDEDDIVFGSNEVSYQNQMPSSATVVGKNEEKCNEEDCNEEEREDSCVEDDADEDDEDDEDENVCKSQDGESTSSSEEDSSDDDMEDDEDDWDCYDGDNWDLAGEGQDAFPEFSLPCTPLLSPTISNLGLGATSNPLAQHLQTFGLASSASPAWCSPDVLDSPECATPHHCNRLSRTVSLPFGSTRAKSSSLPSMNEKDDLTMHVRHRLEKLKNRYKDKREGLFIPDSKYHRKCYLEAQPASTAEAPDAEQQGERRVRFMPKDRLVTVHRIIAWDHASRAARVSDWSRIRRDELRFKKHISQLDQVISPVLSEPHRAKCFQRLTGSQE